MDLTLTADQEAFLSELFELCSRYRKVGVEALSCGIMGQSYLVQVKVFEQASADLAPQKLDNPVKVVELPTMNGGAIGFYRNVV